MVGTPTKLFPKQGISVDNEGKRAFPASSNENLDHGVTTEGDLTVMETLYKVPVGNYSHQPQEQSQSSRLTSE